MVDQNTTSQLQNKENSNAVISSYTDTGATGSTMQGQNAQASNSTSSTQATSSTMQGQTSAQSSAGGAKTAKNVIGVFESRNDAEKAVNELRRQGFTTEEINILSKKDRNQQSRGETETYDDDVSDGALTGGTLGGIGGLLLGAGALAIPGVGPVIAAGPIAAALSGAVAGGVAGGLIDWGIPSEVSQRYEQEVVRGKILAVIRADAAKVNAAAQILRQNGAKDVESHNVK